MRPRNLVPAALLLAVILTPAISAPIELKCPWRAGETWVAGGDGSFYGEGYHTGADYYAVDFNRPGGDDGADILAAAPGTIADAHWSNSYGWHVHVDHGNGITSLYAHLKFDPKSDPGIWVGQSVGWGTCLGKCGNTGWSRGSHLHFCLYQNSSSTEPSPLSGQTVSNGAYLLSDNQASEDPVPASPTDLGPLGAHIAEGGRITFSWIDHPMSNGAPRVANHVYVYPHGGGAIFDSPEIGGGSHSYEWTANVAAGHYEYEVSATNGGARTAMSGRISFWVDPVVPATPTDLSPGPADDPSAGTGALGLRWVDHPMTSGLMHSYNVLQIFRFSGNTDGASWSSLAGDPRWGLFAQTAVGPDQHYFGWQPTQTGQYTWRVKAEYVPPGQQPRPSAWSEWGYFHIVSANVAAPTDLRPGTQDWLLSTETVRLGWTDNAPPGGFVRFDNIVEVHNRDSGKKLTVDSRSKVYGDRHYFDWTPPRPGKYKWLVRAGDGIATTAPSAWGYFRVGPPLIAYSFPRDDCTGVARRTSVTIHFAERVRQQSAEDRFRLVLGSTEIPGSFNWLQPQSVMEFVPAHPLAALTWYEARLSTGIRYVDGTVCASGDEFQFRTGNMPIVTASGPKGTGIGLFQPAWARFDMAMHRKSVENNFTMSPSTPGRFNWTGNTFVKFTPNFWLPNRTYTVTIGAGARSAAGVPMGKAYRWTFTTKTPLASAMTLSAVAQSSAGGATFTVSATADAALQAEVLSIAGRVVATLPDNRLAAGTNTLHWSGKSAYGSACPSGNYLLRLTAADAGGNRTAVVVPFSLRR